MERAVEVQCPTCGEQTAVWVDWYDGRETIESDCQVCCRPLSVAITLRGGEVTSIEPPQFGW